MSSTRSSHLRISLASAAIVLALAACGGDKSASNAQEADAENAADSSVGANDSAVSTPAKGGALNLSSGPDVCFAAVTKHLGADTKVMEVASFFSAGKDIDSSAKQPQGELKLCTVDYQDPANPKKLIGTRLDVATGKFSEPHEIELSVSGDAADFVLEDYLIPLSQVDAAALSAQFDAQKAAIEGVYSKFAWTGVRLLPPGPFSDVPTLRIEFEGRLASNDIKKNGWASVSVDGKTIVKNNLLP